MKPELRNSREPESYRIFRRLECETRFLRRVTGVQPLCNPRSQLVKVGSVIREPNALNENTDPMLEFVEFRGDCVQHLLLFISLASLKGRHYLSYESIVVSFRTLDKEIRSSAFNVRLVIRYPALLTKDSVSHQFVEARPKVARGNLTEVPIERSFALFRRFQFFEPAFNSFNLCFCIRMVPSKQIY